MKKLLSVILSIMLALSLTGSFAEGENTGVYALMNIPYEDFYLAEIGQIFTVDAVASATLMKPRTATLAGGSYHVNADGSDISGVIFPVYAEDLSVIEALGGALISDDSSVDITVTNKGQETTTTYTGSDALFEAPSYSYYVLSEVPKAYKVLSADGSFGEVVGSVQAIDASAKFVYDRHADMVISITGADEALSDGNVSAVVLSAEDGTKVGLKHVENVWRKTQIGFSLDGDVYQALKGKRISEIKYITPVGSFTIAADLCVSDDELLPKLNGTYIDLFTEFAKEEYKEYWLECIKAYVDDDEAALSAYEMLLGACMGTLKGQAAIDAYSANPGSMAYDCYLENGIAKLTINGDEISAVDAEGNLVFSHHYSYLGDADVIYLGQPTGETLRIYEAYDSDEEDGFSFFAFGGDTISSTYHLEFRYGDNLGDMGDFTDGEYAYWLVGAINDNYKENQIKNCIKLFVDENLGEEAENESEAIEISTVEELAAINDNLSGSYVLTADIDLGGAAWQPIGSFMPVFVEGEMTEEPDTAYAFTGTFDGQGHKISNFTVGNKDGFCVGLFGCAANAMIGNFVLSDAKAEGTTMVAAVVGYAYRSEVYGVSITNVQVNGYESEMSGEGMYAGIVGAGMSSAIMDCSADAIVNVPNNSANGGLIGGGLEQTDVIDCIAMGTVNAGDNCYGIGGISGCGFGSKEFTRATAHDVKINLGDNCFWIGGITGYAGGFSDESLGIPVTVLSECVVGEIEISAGENVSSVGAVVGAGFYLEGLAEAYGVEAYANPTAYEIVSCENLGVTLNGEAVE